MSIWKTVQKKIHDILHWGYPKSVNYTVAYVDNFQPTRECEYCNYALAQDSTGAWFHLSREV